MPEGLSAFWTVHSGLPREGPGKASDLFRACGVTGIASRCDLLDGFDAPGLGTAIAEARAETAAPGRPSDRVGYALRVVRRA